MTSNMRDAIAKMMTLSKQTIPHYYLSRSVDVTSTLLARSKANANKRTKVSINDLVIWAIAEALKSFPEFNGYYLQDNFQPNHSINLGVAIALPEGVIAPAILGCDKLDIWQIAEKSKDLAARAKSGALKASEYSSATITISNLGMFGIETFMPIIIPPQVAILGVGTIIDTPVYIGGDWEISQRISLTLAADHRVSDGASGAQLLSKIKEILSEPDRIFIHKDPA